MQVTIFGAAGKVGQRVVTKLLADNHQLVVFVHRHNPYANTPNVTVISGSIDNYQAVATAIQGSQAVISTLGSWGSPAKNIVSTGTETIVQAMTEQGVQRLITVSGAGAFYSQDHPTTIDRLTHRLLQLVAPKILTDGEQHLAVLEASTLDWTCIRSPVMTKRHSNDYELRQALPSLLAYVPREAVAQCLVDQLQDSTYFKKAPVIYHV
ncbi:MAG: SDR family oxidoreductase [Patescibacteria group bacterium]|nr:SDR family oxidoreductase [Patescibacteria group bacterium]